MLSWTYKTNEKSGHFDQEKNFYICSYGGCGSMMLFHYLSNFGNSFHIHSRYPPQKLVHLDTTRKEQRRVYEDVWSNYQIVPQDKLKNYHVIYIYRNPVRAMYSTARRFPFHDHMRNIQCNVTTKYVRSINTNARHALTRQKNLTIIDFIRSRRDICGLEQFFDNYTKRGSKNYDIHCVKYETMFDTIENLNKVLGIENFPDLYPKKKEVVIPYDERLKYGALQGLFIKMDRFAPLVTV